MQLHPALLLSALLVSCSAPRLHPAEDPSRSPYPYTPELIRAANPPGTTLVFDVRQGGAVVRQTMRFEGGDELGTAVVTTQATEEGEPLGEARRGESTWVELRDHASFPAASTVVTEAECSVVSGDYDCWVYRVSGEDGTTSRFYFAKSRPGPPVLLETEAAGETVFRMELVEAR